MEEKSNWADHTLRRPVYRQYSSSNIDWNSQWIIEQVNQTNNSITTIDNHNNKPIETYSNQPFDNHNYSPRTKKLQNSSKKMIYLYWAILWGMV